jgi:hypothetical protein
MTVEFVQHTLPVVTVAAGASDSTPPPLRFVHVSERGGGSYVEPCPWTAWVDSVRPREGEGGGVCLRAGRVCCVRLSANSFDLEDVSCSHRGEH